MQADRRALPALVVLLVLAIASAVLLTQLGALRRTAEASVVVTSAVLEPGGGTKDHRERGFHLEYVYQVGSVAYPGLAFRTWTNVEEHRPKICFNPSNPREHLLVDGDVTCGAGAIFR